MSEPHCGIEPVTEFSQNFVLAGFESVAETYGMVTASTVPDQAFLVNDLRVLIRRDKDAACLAGLARPTGPWQNTPEY